MAFRVVSNSLSEFYLFCFQLSKFLKRCVQHTRFKTDGDFTRLAIRIQVSTSTPIVGGLYNLHAVDHSGVC